MTEKLTILDPTLHVEPNSIERAPRPKHITILGLLNNGKTNSDILLKKVAAHITAQHPDIEIRDYRKSSAYRPAPDELLDQVAEECDAALVGIGD